MKNQIDLVGQFRANWIRYSDYEIRKTEEGKAYLIPTEDATYTLYNPFEVANELVFDLLAIGDQIIKGKVSDERVEEQLCDFAVKYGLLGLVGASVYNRDIVGEDHVLLMKNNLLTKETIMPSWAYIKLFIPFAEEEDVWIRAYKRDITVVKAEDSPKFYGKRPLILDIVFSKFYGEQVEWIKAFAVDLVKHFDEIQIYKDQNLTEEVSIRAGKFKAEKLGLEIRVLEGPQMIWEVDALKTVIELLYCFAVTDEETKMMRCGYCNQIFIAKNKNEKYCSASCRNCFNVIKSRKKKKEAQMQEE